MDSRAVTCLASLLMLIGGTLAAPKVAGAVGAPPPAASVGTFGLDLASQDKTVKPGDDFYEYAIGQWLNTHQIPADRTRWGALDQLIEQADARVRDLIQKLPDHSPIGSPEQKVGDYYRAYVDEDAIDALGLNPAIPAIQSITFAQTYADIAALMGRSDLQLKSPMHLTIDTDAKNPDRYLVSVRQGGLGLPDRDYYLKDEPKFAQLRNQYRAHLAKMLALAGVQDPDRRAEQILALETRMAQTHWPRAKLRERDLTYNIRSLEDLKKLAPGFPWTQMLTAAGLGDRKELNVAEPDAIAALAGLFDSVPVDTWRDYLEVHFLDEFAPVLPHEYDEETFDFFVRKLNGQQQQRERWKRAVANVSDELGEAVGQLYVKDNFSAEAKAQVLDLVNNLRKAYAEHLRKVPWMTPATRKVAAEKLRNFRTKIGYPDRWRDYSALRIRPGDAFGNRVRAEVFEWNRQVKRIDQPTDRDEWHMTPQTVNAYYNQTFNEIVFPAAILQPPFFDPKADPAVNYGAIGSVIGHEMGHGFDDQGAKTDAQGVLRTWWLPADTAAFQRLGDELASQYDTYEIEGGQHVNGRLTLGENIGDLSGVSIAYDAYHRSLLGKKAPTLAGLSGDQRFFLSWAQGWETLMRPERLRNQVMTDPHSPSIFRVNGVVRNVDAWYRAFDVKPGDKLYLAPKKRVRIW